MRELKHECAGTDVILLKQKYVKDATFNDQITLLHNDTIFVILYMCLSYRNGGESKDQAFYGQGIGNTLLDDIVCIGNETILSNCAHDPWLTHNCAHTEDQGVLCY